MAYQTKKRLASNSNGLPNKNPNNLNKLSKFDQWRIWVNDIRRSAERSYFINANICIKLDIKIDVSMVLLVEWYKWYSWNLCSIVARSAPTYLFRHFQLAKVWKRLKIPKLHFQGYFIVQCEHNWHQSTSWFRFRFSMFRSHWKVVPNTFSRRYSNIENRNIVPRDEPCSCWTMEFVIKLASISY